MKLTRRQLAAVVAAPAAAAAQAPPSGAAKELEAARQNLRRNAEALARFKLPPETEPAFQFKP